MSISRNKIGITIAEKEKKMNYYLDSLTWCSVINVKVHFGHLYARACLTYSISVIWYQRLVRWTFGRRRVSLPALCIGCRSATAHFFLISFAPAKPQSKICLLEKVWSQRPKIGVLKMIVIMNSTVIASGVKGGESESVGKGSDSLDVVI